ncbi:type VII secretion protein EssC, partial [Listeria welshimeri]|nr:type VII secretion protein EssC [Listeria welshimeri]
DLTKEVLPEILILIDNYDSIRETDFSFGFEATLTQIAREGNSVGIHLVISATRQNSMRQNLLANLKLQLALYMIEGNEVKSIVGQTKLTITENAGRGLVKLGDPTLFQASFPTRSNGTMEHLEHLEKEMLQMSEYGIYEITSKIPMLPDKISLEEFSNKKSVQNTLESHLFVIGLDDEEAESFAVNKVNQLPLLVTGENNFDISNVIKQFIELESKDLLAKEIIVIDNMKYDFSKYQNDMYIYGNNKTFMETIIQN